MTTFSICICKYDMFKTLETSLNSILRQIDDRFEVIVVDGRNYLVRT